MKSNRFYQTLILQWEYPTFNYNQYAVFLMRTPICIHMGKGKSIPGIYDVYGVTQASRYFEQLPNAFLMQVLLLSVPTHGEIKVRTWLPWSFVASCLKTRTWLRKRNRYYTLIAAWRLGKSGPYLTVCYF